MTTVLNPQAAAWLESLAAAGVDLAQLSVDDMRAASDALLAHDGGEAEPVEAITTCSIPGPRGDIPLRIYTPKGSGLFPIIVFYHGGGWVIGNAASYDNVATRLANRAYAVVVSVDYRLAPEHPFPAAVDDAFAALRWVSDNAGKINGDVERIAVAGDSAGGNLAAVVALLARDSGPRVMYQLLLYPAIDFARQTESFVTNGQGYYITQELVEWFGKQYDADPHDWRASPIRAEDLSGLPPAHIITAEFDPLRDEGAEYARALVEAGGIATETRVEGQLHGFLSMLGAIPDATHTLDEAATRLRDAFRHGWRLRMF